MRGVIARGLAQVGVNVGKALGATTGSVVRVAGKAVVEIAEIFAATVAAVVTVLTTPSDISGVDERVVEEFILRVGDECFRLSWIETKGSDELIWSPPRLRTQLVDCPPSEEPTVHA